MARDDKDMEQDRPQCSAPPVVQRSFVNTAVRHTKAARSRWRFRMRAFHRGIKYGGAPPGLGMENGGTYVADEDFNEEDHTATAFSILPLANSMGIGGMAVAVEGRADIWEDAVWFQDEHCQNT